MEFSVTKSAVYSVNFSKIGGYGLACTIEITPYKYKILNNNFIEIMCNVQITHEDFDMYLDESTYVGQAEFTAQVDAVITLNIDELLKCSEDSKALTDFANYIAEPKSVIISNFKMIHKETSIDNSDLKNSLIHSLMNSLDFTEWLSESDISLITITEHMKVN